jgi:hypothetical protein
MEVDEEQKVEVRFKTDLIQYRVTDKPFSVPVSLNRLGLSQTINFLLGNSASPTPFKPGFLGSAPRCAMHTKLSHFIRITFK